ncbi:MAG: DUF6345 domain-containing protein, partial [Promethearchaeota archaeon]
VMLLASCVFTLTPAAPRLQPAPTLRRQGDTLMVYKTIPLDLTPEQVALQAENMFGLSGDIYEYEGSYYLTVGNKTLIVNRETGATWYTDYTQLWNISVTPTLPNLDTCQAIAEAFLLNFDLLPLGAYIKDAGSANATAQNVENAETLSKILSYSINYGVMLGSIPADGPGAEISVHIGDGGAIIGLDDQWRSLARHSEYAIIHPSELETILDASLHEIDEYEVESQTLVYYAEPGDVNQTYVYPAYRYEITSESEGEEFRFTRYIPATEFSPKVQITSPTYGASFANGIVPDTIYFDCQITYGAAPYNYTWSSVQVGTLATSKSFSTNTLPVLSRDSVVHAHTITVTVVDANGQTCQDVVLITITPGIPIITVAILVIGSVTIAGVGGAALLLRRRRRKLLGLLFALLVVFGFTLVPTLLLGSQGTAVKGVNTQLLQGRPSPGEDTLLETGVEWLGAKDALPFSQANTHGFYDWMESYGGFDARYNLWDYGAWEVDYKHTDFGGIDSVVCDSVDFVYHNSHGNPNGFFFNTMHHDTFMHYSQARWGDGDLEWLILDSCEILMFETWTHNTVFDRWGGALQGVHGILSFDTISINQETRGSRFALFMTGFSSGPFEYIGPSIVRNAWFMACVQTENSNKRAAVLYSSMADDPWNPPLDDPSHDHANGFGYVCSDPIPAKWWVWIAVPC